MDSLKTGSRLLSRGMRGANGALTFIGALLVARGLLKWLDGPAEELVYSRTLKPGERLSVGLTERDT